MSGITGMGTVFSLPNYHGELFAISPADTPLLSSIGGLTGGGMASSVEFEWQQYDLRAPTQNVALEGAPAPTGVGRVRANVRNVCEVHQSKVSVSYTKQSTPGMAATPGAAPYRTDDGTNPVSNELDWQVAQELKQVAIDVNFSFIQGVYANPTDNTTPRKTRGMLNAIVTNAIEKGAVVVGLSAATDTVTETSTARANGDIVIFTDVGASTTVFPFVEYYVVNKSTNAFKVSATSGGAAITIGTATVSVMAPSTTDLSVDNDIDPFVQQVYDNGGLTGAHPMFVVGSRQKRAITKAYAVAYREANPLGTAENVGGVAVDTIRTDFGTFGIMLDRHMPQDVIGLFTLDQLKPVFLNVPDKGVFFEEPLAKVGSSDDVQIYGEIGLAYGSERSHGFMRGLKTTG